MMAARLEDLHSTASDKWQEQRRTWWAPWIVYAKIANIL